MISKQNIDIIDNAVAINKKFFIQKIDFLKFSYNFFSKYCLYFTQFVAGVFFLFLFKRLFDFQINHKEKIRNLTSPLIIVSNHISFYDGLLIRASLGLFPLKIMPLRFMGVLKFNKLFLNILTWIGIIPVFYFIVGVFIIKHGKGLERNLCKAKEILELNHTVVMFPEGKMVYEDKLGSFKVGAAALAIQSGVSVLPISIRKFKKTELKSRIVINIGDLIKLSPQLSYEEGTDVLYTAVKELYEIN